MKLRYRLPAIGLAATLLLTPAAQALTPAETLSLLENYYLDSIPEQVYKLTDVKEMIQELGDPYTQYFTAEEYEAFRASLSDSELVGAGISLKVADNGVLVTRVMSGSAAAEAGMLPGDVITAIDGQSVAGMSQEQASDLLSGEEGSSFQATYLRDGQSTTVTLTRRTFVVPAAFSELRENHIGYITCITFGPDTAGHVLEGLETNAGQADHWLMDLRSNGGGEISAALETISYFIGPGDELVYMLTGDGSLVAQGSEHAQVTDKPLIVLTDAYTASASELFSSAIRDTDSGLVVGGRTYGKGVAQALLDSEALPDLFPNGDALKLTISRFFGPAGTSHDTIGIMPHLLIDSLLADEAAILLSGNKPQGDTSGTVRIDLNGSWYINLEQACSDTYREAFTQVLEALPDSIPLWKGTGDDWEATTAAALAASCGLSSYTHRGFTDTDQSPYADEIDLLATYRVVLGAGDGTYHPSETLTRGQLCTLLAQALNCKTPTGESAFTDVSMDDWYGPAVNALASLGLVNGVGDGRFAPNEPVSHEQFITILARLGRRLNLDLHYTWDERPQSAPAGYESYSSWAWDSVWLLDQGEESLLWTDAEDIQPAGVTTREEAAALTCSLLCELNLLPDLI